MKDNATIPIVGDKILEVFKEKFQKEYAGEKGEVQSLVFWPAAGVEGRIGRFLSRISAAYLLVWDLSSTANKTH